MSFYYRWWRRYSGRLRRFFYTFILSFFIVLIWSTFTTFLFGGDDDDIDRQKPPLIFCFVMSANNRQLTSSRAILYSWGKRCDRFYFVTRLQNTSVDLMMLERFDDISDITPTTITQQTLDILLYLKTEEFALPYHWFLRASDDSYVIIPNLRRLVTRLHRIENERPFAYVGDVEQMYKKYQIATTGSVMLFNRYALERLILADLEGDLNILDLEKQDCLANMIYDHEFVSCMKQIDININPLNENLILSQNLSLYKMDERFKVKYK
jgi:hypothetical protein